MELLDDKSFFDYEQTINDTFNEWKIEKIENLCLRITSGGTPLRSNKEFYTDGKVSWFKTKELKDWFLDDAEEMITDEAIKKSSAKILPPKTILMAMYGDGRTITSLGIIRKESACNQACCALIVDPNVCYFLYLFYTLKYYKEQFLKLAIGGAQRNLSATIIRNFKVKLPPLPTQRKIAAILSAYDDLIENNTRRIAILEEMARRLYQEWFVHFRYPGHQSVPLVDSPLGPIPQGWQSKTLGNIAQEVRRSISPDKVNPETPYIGLEHLPRRSIALTEWGKASQVQSTKLAFKEGEILFGKIRPNLHKVGIAPVDGVCSSDTIVIRAKESNYLPVTLLCVSSDEFVKHASATSQGTQMPRADWNVLLKYQVAIPPESILQVFNDFVGNSIKQINILSFRNTNLRRTRDLLLPRLISGELDVGHLDIVVPETVLV